MGDGFSILEVSVLAAIIVTALNYFGIIQVPNGTGQISLSTLTNIAWYNYLIIAIVGAISYYVIFRTYHGIFARVGFAALVTTFFIMFFQSFVTLFIPSLGIMPDVFIFTFLGFLTMMEVKTEDIYKRMR